MRKSIVLLLVIAIMVGSLTIGAATAEGNGKKVMYTVSAASLGKPMIFGQPSGSGMVLFDDGSMKGMIAVSTESSTFGQLIFQYHPVSWVGPVPGVGLVLTLELRWIKGFAPYPTTLVIPMPADTGGPIFVDNDGDGDADFMLRVTPVS
jgi:hypothetical protein